MRIVSEVYFRCEEAGGQVVVEILNKKNVDVRGSDSSSGREMLEMRGRR
mgnify:CR=1 FL=1